MIGGAGRYNFTSSGRSELMAAVAMVSNGDGSTAFDGDFSAR